MIRTSIVAVLAAASLVLGAAQARAHSMPTAVEDLAGHHQGFFHSSVTGEIGVFALDLTATHNRQLDGVLSSPTLPVSLPFHVTVSASNNFTAVSPGGAFVVHGSIVSWFEHADYRLRAGGTTDVGTLDFFQSFPDAGAVQLPRALGGSFVRDDGQQGRIDVDISGQQGSNFQGTAMFGDLPFPFVGSIGASTPGGPDRPGSAPVHALSVTPFGTLLVEGTWVSGPQPHLDGMVTAMFADGSVHTASFVLAPARVIGGD
jgi:hypothetical protein